MASKRMNEIVDAFYKELRRLGLDTFSREAVERMVSGQIDAITTGLGLTRPHVMKTYVTQSAIESWAQQIKDQETQVQDAIAATDPMELTPEQGLQLVPGLAMVARLAVRAAIDGLDELPTASMASDATIYVSVLLRDRETATIFLEGDAVARLRRVYVRALQALKNTEWRCTCNEPHDFDRCIVARGLAAELTIVGGWVPEE